VVRAQGAAAAEEKGTRRQWRGDARDLGENGEDERKQIEIQPYG
jgi:hypothetical protein